MVIIESVLAYVEYYCLDYTPLSLIDYYRCRQVMI